MKNLFFKTFIIFSFLSVTSDVLANNNYGEDIETFFGAMFYNSEFESIDKSSSYGLELDHYNFGNSYVGFTLGSTLNFGISEDTSALFMLGPNVSYQVANNVLLAMPVCALGNVYFEGKGKEQETKMGWGWMVNPKVQVKIKKVSLQLGLVVNGGFEGGSVNVGFNAAIGIGGSR